MDNVVIWFVAGVAIFAYAAWRAHLFEKALGEDRGKRQRDR